MTEREPYRRRLSCRMADEGIPIAAIARIMQKDPGAVRVFLREEHAHGRLRAMPAMDWAVSAGASRGGNRSPTVPKIDPALIEGDSILLQSRLGLTGSESLLLAILLMFGQALRPTLLSVINPAGSSMKLIDVMVCKIRKKLRERDVTIETLWGRGYRMADVERGKLRAMIIGLPDLGRPIAREPAHAAA